MNEPPIAVMLAAGFGVRLGSLTRDMPKCLLEVGGRSLLAHSLARLADSGVQELLVVLGHHAALIEAAVAEWSGPPAIRTCRTRAFATEGSLGSLRAGLAELGTGRDVLVLESDLLYHAGFLAAALRAPGDTLLTADPSGSGDEVYVGADGQGRLSFLGKQVAPADRAAAIGEFAGISRLSPPSLAAFLDCAGRWLGAGRVDAHYEEALLQITRDATVAIAVRHCGGLPWTEVDNAADLARARERVWPALQAAGHG